ncbi:MAG: hypothetical protein MUE63_13430, partial [Xanthomonadales bacterium]|nr:hypothetical protein [Xanthomonadales bacterium]
MRCSTKNWAAAAVLALALAGCGGGGDDGPAAPVPPPPPSNTPVGQALAAAAANPANDTSVNSSSAFKAVQAAGVPAVMVGGGVTRV